MPRQTKHTKQKFLDAGTMVVLEKGFDAASVADIAKTAGAPKGSFFNHFESKDDFGAELIRHFGEAERRTVQVFLEEFDGTPLQKLRAMVQQMRDNFVSAHMSGCLVGAMTQTVAGRDEACRLAADAHFKAGREVLSDLVMAAQKAGEIDAEIDPETFASLFQSAVQGAMINAKSRRDAAPFDEILDVLLKAA